MKSVTKKAMGLLMPLPIPEAVWEDISTCFITCLSKVRGKSVFIVRSSGQIDKIRPFGGITD